MSKSAFLTLLNRNDSALSPHFAKARWIAILDENGQILFEENTTLEGRTVVEAITKHGCKDIVFVAIGPGAYSLLQAAGIRAWLGPSGVPLPQLAEMLRRGALATAQPHEPCGQRADHANHQQGAHRCCCGGESSCHRQHEPTV